MTGGFRDFDQSRWANGKNAQINGVLELQAAKMNRGSCVRCKVVK